VTAPASEDHKGRGQGALLTGEAHRGYTKDAEPAMAGKSIKVEVPDELWVALSEVSAALGIASVEEAAVIALAEWAARRKGELDDRDPSQRYFVNEALDELAARATQKK
jgi:hypothetical protein